MQLNRVVVTEQVCGGWLGGSSFHSVDCGEPWKGRTGACERGHLPPRHEGQRLRCDENSRMSQQHNVERGSQHFKHPHRLSEVNITHQQSKSTNGPSGNQYPSSCDDLYKMGHTLSGVYSVIGSRSVETVYCDFYKTQNQLGNIGPFKLKIVK